jgi:adenine-specific DNA-methyltransferase
MNKTELLQKVKEIEGLNQDERAYLINLVNTKKKYGLVWEEKPEEVEEQLRDNLPILKEVKEKAILNGIDYPNHILIEGDNLVGLTSLTFTHEGKLDVIYIDPPYNTGNKDFKYNDTFVDKEDGYRHSKWLSFMNKRLKIAKKLLSQSGAIFISIDDNELTQLKLLCDEIFSESNLLGIVTIAKGTTTGQDAKKFGSSCDYILVYGMPQFELGKLQLSEKDKKRFSRTDDNGNYAILQFRKTGNNDRRENRPNLFYPVIDPDGNEVYPYGPGGYESTWRGDMKYFNRMVKENMLEWVKQEDGWKPYVKFYMEGRGKAPSNLWTEIDGNKKATIELKDIFGDKVFTNPKPTDLIRKCLEIGSSSDAVILDFFAGSGTTMQAVMQLNEADEGNRQCILITNNENNICEEITYERNKRVINGYNNINNEVIDGLLNNNLRYFKTDLFSRETSLKNKRELTQLATELLCIKEDCYNEEKIKIKQSKLFVNNNVTLLILFDDHVIPQAVELIKGIEATEIKVYVFSVGSDPYTEDFAEVLDKITLCALPDAIYKAYQNILPNKKRSIPLIEESSEIPTNENGEQLSIL